MSLHPVVAFSVHCDRCGEQFEDGDFTIFSDEPCYEDHDWWERTIDGGVVEHYCSACLISRWTSDDEGAGDDIEDELIHTIKPIPAPHAFVRDPRWSPRPEPLPGEACVADGCGLRPAHATHVPAVTP